MGLVNIPILVKHVTIAIWTKQGKVPARFHEAFDIARSQLVKQGYLAPGSQLGPAERIRLTSAGVKRNRKHLREGAHKNREFDRVYEKLELTMAAGTREQNPPPEDRPDVGTDR